MGIEKTRELNRVGEMDIRQLVENNNLLNEVMKDSWDIEENKHSKEIIEIELLNSKEILQRKQTALLQTLDILRNVIAYGEVDEELRLLQDSLKNTNEDIRTIDTDIEELKIQLE